MPTYRLPVTISHPSLGGTGINTWHVRTTSAIISDAVELEGLSDMIQTFYGNITAVLAPGTAFNMLGEATTVGEDPQINNTPDPWTVTAGTTGAILPPANTICFSWKTNSATRSGRGRTFVGPLLQSAVDPDGTILTARLTTLRAAAATLADASDSFANGAVGVWSPTQGIFRDIVSGSVRDRFAVLRSRRD